MNRCLAEAVGTFALIFAGCGAIVVNAVFPESIGHAGISLTFGLVVMAMIYSVGNVSGAHLNPAVKLGFLFAGRFDRKDVLPYIGSQLVGGFAAAGLLFFLFPEAPTLGATFPHVGVSRSFLMETALTFLLMFVILNVSTGHKEKGIMAGVAIGGTIAFEALMGGPATGASMNPVRSLAPAVLSGEFTGLWVYLTAPVLGAFLAHPCCKGIQGPECCTREGNPPGSCSGDEPKSH